MSGMKIDLERLLVLPSEVFFMVVGKLRMSEILYLRSYVSRREKFKRIAELIDSPGMWAYLLERDFGETVFGDFRKRRYMNGGIKPIFQGDVRRLAEGKVSQEELYYKYRFKRFDEQVVELRDFVNEYYRYHSYIPDAIKAILNNIKKDMNLWVESSRGTQRDYLAEFHRSYSYSIDFLASDCVNQSTKCLILAMRFDCPEIALSLIPLSGKYLNVQDGDFCETPLLLAILRYDTNKKENDYEVLNALLRHGEVNPYLENRRGINAFNFPSTRKVAAMVYYSALRNSKYRQRNELFSKENQDWLGSFSIYNHIISLVNETTDTELKEKIVKEALAETMVDDEGEHPSLLREYLTMEHEENIPRLGEIASDFKAINEEKRVEEAKMKKQMQEAKERDMESAAVALASLPVRDDEDKEDTISVQPSTISTSTIKTRQSTASDYEVVSSASSETASTVDLRLFTGFNASAAAVVVGACVGFVLHFGFHMATKLVVPGTLLSVIGVLVLAYAVYRCATLLQTHTKTPMVHGYRGDMQPLDNHIISSPVLIPQKHFPQLSMPLV